MVLWNLIFNSEVVEQRFRARVLTHHERSSSDNGHPKTAWSHYAAKQLLWPYRLHRNQLIRTVFFNTHTTMHSFGEDNRARWCSRIRCA
jgi:hypothetical protein